MIGCHDVYDILINMEQIIYQVVLWNKQKPT